MMRIGHDGIRPYVEQLWKWDQAEQERRFRESFDLDTIKIVCVDGRDVGYLDVKNHDDHLLLAGIYLDSQYRRLGLGSKIIGDLLMECARLHKPLRLRVLRSNPAQRLYRRLGFRSFKETESHIYMESSVRDENA